MRYHPGPRKAKIKLLVLLVAAMAVGAAATYGFLGRQQHGGGQKSKAQNEQKKETAPEAEPTYVDMGAFLVNLVSPDRLRYLRAEVTLGVVDTQPQKKKAEHGEGGSGAAKLAPGDDAKARDVIVQVLSRQSFARLRTQGPDAELRKTLQEELARQLTHTKVVSVLFTSFVMQ